MLNRPMGHRALHHHGHGHRLPHVRDNPKYRYADDNFHTHDYDPVDHICPDADYKMHPQNLDHESMNRRYSRFDLQQKYYLHGVLFPIHHHDHAHY